MKTICYQIKLVSPKKNLRFYKRYDAKPLMERLYDFLALLGVPSHLLKAKNNNCNALNSLKGTNFDKKIVQPL